MFEWSNDKIPILQLGDEFYDPVKPALFSSSQLRYWNNSLQITDSKEHFSNFKPLVDNLIEPLALRYHGHQFQHYNPDLGDGRGFLFAQVKKNNQWFDLGTKGSGQTPYSRAGDGRLTLKGAYREILATELLQSLGVNTSKTLSVFETGEELIRYDEPSPARSAVLTRFSQGHIRIGTFQRLAYFNELSNIKKLSSYCLFFYYPEVYKTIDTSDDTIMAQALFDSAVKRIANLASQVMLAGFVHGVLNTDNINISGELFDYGPYRFLPYYNPEFTAAYFDSQGLYCYGRQPAAFLWALQQFGLSLKLAIPNINIEKTLESFSENFTQSVQKGFLNRLNLVEKSSTENSKLLSHFFQMLQGTKLGFEDAFYNFHSKRALSSPSQIELYNKTGAEFLKQLDTYEINRTELTQHLYFKNETPCTLIIDEIETLWKNIEQNDDWSLFNNKLLSIRSMRGLY